MKTKRQILGGMLAAALFAAAGCFVMPGSAMAQDTDNADTEVLTRGPVHEAFAETVVYDPEPGITVPKQPPEPIEEVQPDQRPVGTNVTWIPGYWAWDDDDSDFFWISGVWRNLPPDREWVPGYWSPVENNNYQWTSGYWEDANTEEVSYLPQPPKSLEKGPNVEASSDNQVWIPGTWQYRNDNYAWRAGYWVDARPNYAWTPSYYRWTPRGYVYVDGYWDYPVVNRGVVFAPVRFRRPVYYERPDYYYTPATVISLAVFTNHLFVRPRYGHYYFGDYYDPGYRERYYASYDYGRRYRGYDPIYVHSRWEHRHDRNWERQRREFFEYRRDNVGSRPPRTWAAYNRLPERERERGEYRMADRLDRMVGDRDGRVRFQKVDEGERQRINTQRKAVREFGRERAQRERTGQRAKSDGEGRGQAAREKVKRSPVVAKRDTRDEKAGGPPPRLQRRDADGEKNERGNRAGNEGAAGNTNPGNAAKEREERTKPGQRRETAEGNKGEGGNNGNARKDQPNREGGNRGDANKGDGNREGNRGEANKQAGGNGGNRGEANKGDGNREGNRGEANKQAGGNGGNRGDSDKGAGNREGARGDANKGAGGNGANRGNPTKGEGSGSGGNRSNAGDGGKKATPSQGGGERKAAPNQGGGQKKASPNSGGGEKKAAPAKKAEPAQPKRESAQAQPRKAERRESAQAQPRKAEKPTATKQASQQKASNQGAQQRKAQNSPQRSSGQKKSSGDGGGGKKDGGKKDKE